MAGIERPDLPLVELPRSGGAREVAQQLVGSLGGKVLPEVCGIEGAGSRIEDPHIADSQRGDCGLVAAAAVAVLLGGEAQLTDAFPVHRRGALHVEFLVPRPALVREVRQRNRHHRPIFGDLHVAGGSQAGLVPVVRVPAGIQEADEETLAAVPALHLEDQCALSAQGRKILA